MVRDEHKISVSNDAITFKKRNKNIVPSSILALSGDGPGALLHYGLTLLSELTLTHWFDYGKYLSSNVIESEIWGDEDADYSSNTRADLWESTGDNSKYSKGNIGIGSEHAGTILQITGTEPYITVKNTSSENQDSGCESRIIFEDHSNTSIAQIEASHEGAQNDTKGQLIFSTHTGSTLTEAVRITSTQNFGIGITSPTEKLHVNGNTIITGDLNSAA